RNVCLTLQGLVAQHGPGLAPEGGKEAVAAADRRAEAHVEGPQDPHHENDGKSREGQHHAVDRPALLHDPAIENDQPGHAHQADEGGGGHLPCVVTRSQPRGSFDWHVSPCPALERANCLAATPAKPRHVRFTSADAARGPWRLAYPPV